MDTLRTIHNALEKQETKMKKTYQELLETHAAKLLTFIGKDTDNNVLIFKAASNSYVFVDPVEMPTGDKLKANSKFTVTDEGFKAAEKPAKKSASEGTTKHIQRTL